MRHLLESGSRVDQFGTSGNPPLHWAVWHNKVAEANLLLVFGADPYQRNLDEETAFEVAGKDISPQMTELLSRWKRK